MFSFRAATFVALICFATGACSAYPTAPEKEEEIPDFGGQWKISLSGLHEANTGGTNAHHGFCTAVKFQVTVDFSHVEEGVWGGDTHHYSGAHSGFTLTCFGIGSSPATEVFGLADTVIVVEPGTVSGRAFRRACIGFWCDPGPTWMFSVSGEDFHLYLGGEDNHFLSGEFFLLDPSDDPNVVGVVSTIR